MAVRGNGPDKGRAHGQSLVCKPSRIKFTAYDGWFNPDKIPSQGGRREITESKPTHQGTFSRIKRNIERTLAVLRDVRGLTEASAVSPLARKEKSAAGNNCK